MKSFCCAAWREYPREEEVILTNDLVLKKLLENRVVESCVALRIHFFAVVFFYDFFLGFIFCSTLRTCNGHNVTEQP